MAFTKPADLERGRISYTESDTAMLSRMAQTQRWDSMANVYAGVDTILCSAPVEVKAGDFSHMGVPAPAWNDGKTIYLNTAILRALDDQTLIGINGINYHEVAHILYSPRFTSAFMQTVVAKGMKQTWNMMDDQRIETLLVGRYPSVKESLTHTVLTYLLEDGNPETAFPLIRGRKYLPIEVRQSVADAWVAKQGQAHAQALADVLDEYRLCIYPRDEVRMLELVAECHALLMQTAPEQPEQPQDGQPQDGQAGSGQGQPDVSKDGMCSGDANLIEHGEPESTDEQAQDSESAQEQGESESIENSAASGAFGNSGSDDESNDDCLEAIKDAINNALNSIMNDESVLADLEQIRDAISADNKVQAGLRSLSTTEMPVSAEGHAIAEEFARELNELLCDSDAMWVSHQSTGRVNIKRAMNMGVNDLDTVFDRWDDGDLAYDIEAVILVDRSSSMTYQMAQTNESAWAVKRGLESINGDVTVLAFGDSARVIYGKDELATHQARQFRASGGTEPCDALIEAERILEQSTRTTKMLIMLSDGDWSGDGNKVIARINQIEGAITASVFLPDEGEQMSLQAMNGIDRQARLTSRQHNCQTLTVITDPKQLVNVARDICRGL